MSVQQLTTNSVIDKAINTKPSKLLTIKEFIDVVEYDIDRLYIDKFWLSLYEQSNNEFGIYLDMPLIKMIGFAAKDDKTRKGNCIRLLKNFAINNQDYKVVTNEKNGYIENNYYLTSDCFRRLILKANTKYTDKIHSCYISLEKLHSIYESYKVIFNERQSRLIQYEEKEEADDRNMIEYMFDNQSIRIIQSNDESYFVGKDIASILGYKKARNALNNHVDIEDRITMNIIEKRGPESGPLSLYQNIHPQTILINESGLYSLILSSKLPAAKKFKRYVTSEVLPSIRRTGEYKLQKQLQIKDTELQLQRAEHQKQLANYQQEMERLKRLANLPRIDEKISTDSLLYIATNSEMMKQNIFKIGHVKRATRKAMKERLQNYQTGYSDPLRLIKIYAVRNAATIDTFFKDISQHYKQPSDKAKELVTMPYEWLCAYLDKLITNNQSIIEDINERTMNEYEQAMATPPTNIKFLTDEEWQAKAGIELPDRIQEEKTADDDIPDYIQSDGTIDYTKFIDKLIRDNNIKAGDIVRWQKLRILSTAEKNKQKITINYDQVKNTIKINAATYKIAFKCAA